MHAEYKQYDGELNISPNYRKDESGGTVPFHKFRVPGFVGLHNEFKIIRQVAGCRKTYHPVKDAAKEYVNKFIMRVEEMESQQIDYKDRRIVQQRSHNSAERH